MAAGLIGRNIQERDEQQCVGDFEALGFKRINEIAAPQIFDN